MTTHTYPGGGRGGGDVCYRHCTYNCLPLLTLDFEALHPAWNYFDQSFFVVVLFVVEKDRQSQRQSHK